MRSRSHWDYGLPVSKLRSRLSTTAWMLLSCLYLSVCGEDVEVIERFTYLGCDIHVCWLWARGQQTSGSGLGSHGFTGSWGVALPVPVRKDESPSLQVLGASSLALRMRDLDSDQGSEMAT